MSLELTVLTGSFILITAVLLVTVTVRTPLKMSIFKRSREPRLHPSLKFKNDAPVAPDMLFGMPEQPLPTYEQIPPRPRFTLPDPDDFIMSDTQIKIAKTLWDSKQVTCVAINEQDMIAKKGDDRILGFIRCLDRRVHVGDIKDLVKQFDHHNAVYLVATKQIDQIARRMIMQRGIRVITPTRLDKLTQRFKWR